ncbi:hypothetical protein [Nostoc sp.]
MSNWRANFIARAGKLLLSLINHPQNQNLPANATAFCAELAFCQ